MRYDAFISYRHADLDLSIAKMIHKGLETYRVPRGVAAKAGKKNIKRVFRDQEELPIGSDLGDNITRALAESEFLIVICSPRTPGSYWVQKEITTFIKLHGRNNVLAVLIEGEPEQSFPRQLLEDEEGNPVEPLAADVRGSTRREINRKMKSEIMRLAAPLLYCSYDDLRQRHKERKMRQAAVACGAVAVGALLFGAYSTYNAAMIRQNYEGKQRNQSKYLADMALDLFEEGDRRAAVLVALNALPAKDNDRPYVPQAQYALSRALRCYDMGNKIGMDRVLQHDQPVQDVWMNSEGTRSVSIDQGKQIYVWDVENGKKLLQIAPRYSEDGYVIEPNGAMLAGDNLVICDKMGLRSLTLDGQERWTVENPESVLYCELDEKALLAVCVNSKMVRIYNMESGAEVGVMPNTQEMSYTGEIAFAEDGTKVAVAHLIMDDEILQGCISVYDLQTETVTDYATTDTYISAVEFTTDGQLVVAGGDSRELMLAQNATGIGCLQKINLQDGKTIWQQEYEYQIIGTQASSTHMLCRSYEDSATGVTQNEILMTVDNTAYTWENESGNMLSRIVENEGIVQLHASTNSHFGYLAQRDGTIDIVNMTNGQKYSNSAIGTNRILNDTIIRNGVLLLRSYASTDLTVMKYMEGSGMVALEEYDDYIKKIEYSAEESYYAIHLYGEDIGDRILFYGTKDNILTGEDETENSVVASEFVTDKEYVIIDSKGGIFFYDATNGQREALATGEWFSAVDVSINRESKLALLYDGYRYGVVDLQSRTLLYSQEMQGYLESGLVSHDGKYIYGSIRDEGVRILESETGAFVETKLSQYEAERGLKIDKAFILSEEGRLLAVCCRDNVLRVYDTEQKEIIAEIPFLSSLRRYVEFCQNDSCLLLQGDDYYLRVYDLEKKDFVYVATDQYYEIQQMVKDKKKDTISLVTSTDLIILNGDDYERVAQIEGGLAYLPGQGKILSSQYGQMYQFPYMDLEMLQEEAKRQFPEEQLSTLEKIRYHVE